MSDTHQWDRDQDAQGHSLQSLGSDDPEHIYTSARKPDRVVWRDDAGTYHADGPESEVASGEEIMAVVQQAVASLTTDRMSTETVLVASPGTVTPEDDVRQVEVPSFTRLDIPATIRVDGGNVTTLHAESARHVEIPRLSLAGDGGGVWFQSVSDVRFGHVEMELDGVGGGIRIGSVPNGSDVARSKDVRIDSLAIEHSAGHALETYSVDGFQLGRALVDTAETGCGVLLNDTTDATVGAINARNIDVGGGYAAFRVANQCRDVTCDQVIMRGGARGIFGVTGCENVTVGEVDIVGADANGILIQDCQNVTIDSGVVRNCDGEAVRIDSRYSTDQPPARGVCVSNLRVYDDRDEPNQTYGIRETMGGQPPETNANRIVNCDLRDAGTVANLDISGQDTIVENNLAAGVDSGTVSLSSGADVAARVDGVTNQRASTLSVRAKPFEKIDESYAWESYFVWDGDAEQWDLVFEWRTDPGRDLAIDYIVDRPQATVESVGGAL